MAQKFNWGAALMSAGQSLDEYAERKRREMMAKALREQQQADLAEQREYDDQRWLERLNITDPLMPVPGDVREYVGLPESSSFAVPVPGAAFGSPLGGPPVPTMARTSAVKNWQSMIPEAPKPAVPPAEVVINRGGQQQVILADPTRVPQAVAAFETALEVPVLAGTDAQGRPNYNMVPVPRPTPVPRPSVVAGPKPIDLQRRADIVTESALGPSTEKTTAGGTTYDFSMGGTQARGDDLQNLVNPAVRRAMWQAAIDSSAAADSTGALRWPIDSPTDVLAGKIWETVSPQYAEVALPPGWEFRAGDPNTTADDEFVGIDMGIGKFDKKKKPLAFFKEFIVPEVNKAKDEKLGWQALVNSAGQYGLDPNDLLPMLDKRKFAWLFKQAESANVERDIDEVFK